MLISRMSLHEQGRETDHGCSLAGRKCAPVTLKPLKIFHRRTAFEMVR